MLEKLVFNTEEKIQNLHIVDGGVKVGANQVYTNFTA